MKRILQFIALLLSVCVTVILLTNTTSANDLFQNTTAIQEFLNGSSSARASVPGSTSSVPVGRAHNYSSDRMKVYRIGDVLQVFAILPNGTGYQAAEFSVNGSISNGQKFTIDNKFFVRVYYIGKNAGGEHVFQINLYDAGGVLLDDRFTFTRNLGPN